MTAHASSRRTVLGGIAGIAALPLLARAGQAKPLPDSLDAIAQTRGLRFGTAVDPDQLSQSDIARLIADQCSVLVAENAFKWKAIERVEGKFQLDGARQVADFARRNGMLLRGHTMMWNQDNRIPAWVAAKEAELASNGGAGAARLLETHVRRMAKWFPDVASWDVVNEVIVNSTGKVRSAVWSRALGDRMIDIAFHTAREAAPNAQLVYNDYMSWDMRPEHRNGVLRLLEGALKRKVPIQALGIQSHLSGTLNRKVDEAGWRHFLETVEGMGLDILITELDCGDRNVEKSDIALRDARSAAHVKAYLDLTLSFRRVKQVVLWAISDRDNYMNEPGYEDNRHRPDGLPQRGMPFDDRLKPKPMRAAIAAALAAAPKR